MSDQIQDIFRITQMGVGLGSALKEGRLQAEQKQFDDQYNAYYKGLTEDPDNFSPNVDDPNFQSTAFNKALMDYTKAQMNTEDLKAKRFDNIKADIDRKQALMMKNAQRAESIAATDPQAAVASYMDSYNTHVDGINATPNPEKPGEWIFEDQITGEKWAREITLDEARQTYQAVIDKKAYAELYLTDRSRIKAFNEAAVLHPDVLENAKGEKINALTMIDPQTGEKKSVYLDARGRQLNMSAEDLLRGGFQLAKDRQEERLKELGITKAKADIAKVEADTSKAKADAGESRAKADYYKKSAGAVSEKKKDALTEIEEAYGVSRAKAMDIMRSDKNFASRLAAAKEAIKAADLDPSHPDDAAQIQAILKDYAVDKMPGQEGYGLPKVPDQMMSAHSSEAGPGVGAPPAPAGQSPEALYKQLRSQGLGPSDAAAKVKEKFPNIK